MLEFTLYDAQPDWMASFVRFAEAHGGRPVPVRGSIEVVEDDDGPRVRAHFQATAAVPEGADFGYYVIPHPEAPGYERCVLFAPKRDPDDLRDYDPLSEAIQDARGLAWDMVIR